jgi:hypothetical protein
MVTFFFPKRYLKFFFLVNWSNDPMMGKPKSLVDKIQQDFPRTPSPIYTKTREELLGLAPTVTLRTGQVFFYMVTRY